MVSKSIFNFTYIHLGMVVVLLFKDLTWQVVERDKVSDLLLLHVLDNDCVDDAFLGHQVVAYLLLAELKVHVCIFHLLLVEGVDLRQVFRGHESGLTYQVDVLHVMDLHPLHVLGHGVLRCQRGEACLDVLLGVEGPVEVVGFTEGSWKCVARCVDGRPYAI